MLGAYEENALAGTKRVKISQEMQDIDDLTFKGRSTLCVQKYKIFYARTSKVSTLYKTAFTSVTA